MELEPKWAETSLQLKPMSQQGRLNHHPQPSTWSLLISALFYSQDNQPAPPGEDRVVSVSSWPSTNLTELEAADQSGDITVMHLDWPNIILAFILIMLMLTTAVGNLFVIVAILIERNLRTIGNYLVLSLAIADLLVALLVMPLAGIYQILNRWTLGVLLCDIWTSADVFCCTASILHLLAIALDRYWAVTRVDYIRCQRNKRRILFMIFFVWITASVISLAPIFGWKDAQFEWRITNEQECLMSQDIGYQIFATCTTFYFPLTLTLIFYWKIYQVARKRIRRKPGNRIKVSLHHPSSSSSSSTPAKKHKHKEPPQKLIIGQPSSPSYTDTGRCLCTCHYSEVRGLTNNSNMTSPYLDQQEARNDTQFSTKANIKTIARNDGYFSDINDSPHGVHSDTRNLAPIAAIVPDSSTRNVNEALQNRQPQSSSAVSSPKRHLYDSQLELISTAIKPTKHDPNNQVHLESVSHSILVGHLRQSPTSSRDSTNQSQMEEHLNDFDDDNEQQIPSKEAPQSANSLDDSSSEVRSNITTKEDAVDKTALPEACKVKILSVVPGNDTKSNDYITTESKSTNMATCLVSITKDGTTSDLIRQPINGGTKAPTKLAQWRAGKLVEFSELVHHSPMSLWRRLGSGNQSNLSAGINKMFSKHQLDYNSKAEAGRTNESTHDEDVCSTCRCNIENNSPNGEPIIHPIAQDRRSSVAQKFQNQSPLTNQQTQVEGLESKRERKAAKTLAIITGVFVMCWLPFFVMALARPLLDLRPHQYLFAFLLWLGYVNSMLNPIIYTIFSPDFRKAFNRLLCSIDVINRRGSHYNRNSRSRTTSLRSQNLGVRRGKSYLVVDDKAKSPNLLQSLLMQCCSVRFQQHSNRVLREGTLSSSSAIHNKTLTMVDQYSEQDDLHLCRNLEKGYQVKTVLKSTASRTHRGDGKNQSNNNSIMSSLIAQKNLDTSLESGQPKASGLVINDF